MRRPESGHNLIWDSSKSCARVFGNDCSKMVLNTCAVLSIYRVNTDDERRVCLHPGRGVFHYVLQRVKEHYEDYDDCECPTREQDDTVEIYG